ncbi:HECT-type E3 ubiquitin transferase [Ranunculus cassubicifolius]
MEENRSRKRDELIESLPADKRICSLNIPVPMMTSPEIETTATTSSSSPSISGRSSEPDHKMTMMDSASNGSCDSDGGEELDHQYEAVAAGQLAAGARVFRYNGRQLQVEKSKIKNIASNLKAEAGPGSQFAAVTELCDILSFCSEELPGSYAELLAPGLVALTKEESNPDIVILSIRCITYLCDIVYQSSVSLVHYDVLPALCARLMNIEYLDVAEQCLQALERISEEQPHACLEAGVILASLSYIDFFSTSIQRVALSTVANVCKDLPADRTSLYMDAVPILCNLLQYEDQKLVENVASSLIRIVERVKNSSDLLEEVCKHGLIHQATHLIALNSRSPLTQSVHTGLIGMLCTLASGSVAAVRTLLELNISDTLKQILSSYDLARDVVRGDQCNQVHKFMKLLNELLPPLTGNSEEAPIVSDKEKILADQPELLQQFGVNILPVLVQVVSSGVNLHVSYCCLSVINKLVHFSRPEMLLQFLESTNISSFLASAFTRKDRHVLIVVLDIVENIMKKLPDVFLCTFIKEGVVYGIDTLLLLPENCSDDSSMSSSIQLLPRSSQRPAAREVARCLCYAFEIEQSPPSSATTCKLEEGCVHTLAKRIKDSYFATKSDNSGIGLTETLEKLRNLCGMLVDKVHVSMENHFCVQQEESLSHLLGEIMSVLNAGDMSTFEFIESGIVKSLLTYLSNDHATKEKVGVHGHVDNSDVIVHRLEMFARLSLCSSGRNWEGTPFAVLIKKLQSALSSLENFPIILSHVSKPRTTHASIPLERNTLLPCLRVRFVREEGETGLGDYAASAVTIEPFSTLNDIEKFLLPKVRKQIAEHHDDQSTDKPEDLPIQGSSSSCPQVEDQSELNIYDIQSIDPELGRTMLEFQALAERKNNSQSTSESYFRNTRIEDLWLEFSLPGYPDYMLSTGDQHKMVNFMNLEEYVSSILDATVNSGISRQVEAFKSGFNQLFPVKNLQIFTEDELERLLCGEQDAWTSIELLEHIKFDHGYSASSPPIVNLLEIIQEFDYDQKRAFLQFVTGAPRLPPGGLAALNPQLTVVRKVCTEWVDGDLPSVMTCANYLKLPPYSTKERMRERLLYAITEGQGSFHLS